MKILSPGKNLRETFSNFLLLPMINRDRVCCFGKLIMKWFKLAAKQGNQLAEKNLKALGAQ